MVSQQLLTGDHPTMVLDWDDFRFSVQVLIRGHRRLPLTTLSYVLGGLEFKPTGV